MTWFYFHNERGKAGGGCLHEQFSRKHYGNIYTVIGWTSGGYISVKDSTEDCTKRKLIQATFRYLIWTMRQFYPQPKEKSRGLLSPWTGLS